MAEAGQIGIVAREGKEAHRAALADKHRPIPRLTLRADEELSAGPEEDDLAAALAQKGQGVCDIPIEGFGSADRIVRRQLGMGSIVRGCFEPQQIEHHNTALKSAPDKGFARLPCGLKMADRRIHTATLYLFYFVVGLSKTPDARRSACARMSGGQSPLHSSSLLWLFANRARVASSKPGKSPAIACMK